MLSPDRFVTLFAPAIAALAIVAGTVHGQDQDPYGRVDPVEASRGLIQRTFDRRADMSSLAVFDLAPPAGLDRLLDVLTRHPNGGVRTTAAIGLVQRDAADPARLMRALGDADTRSAFIIGLFGQDLLDAETARALLADATDDLPPIAVATLAARAGARDRLKSLLEPPTGRPLAAGIAAGVLESNRGSGVAGWLDSLSELDETVRDTAILATISSLRRLGAADGLRSLMEATTSRPPDDAIRAECLLALLHLDPEAGMAAWLRLVEDGGEERLLSNAILLLTAAQPIPVSIAERLPTADGLQKAVVEMLTAPPDQRPRAAMAAAKAGHLPTLRWLLTLEEGEVPPEVLDQMIDTALRRRRGAMIEILVQSSARLARTAPDRIGLRLETATEERDDAAVELLLRALALAASPEAAAVAKPYLTATARRTRSLALLAVASGDLLDGPAVRRLGRVAAGGGDLPTDLRPLAAWHHLMLEGQLDDILERLQGP